MTNWYKNLDFFFFALPYNLAMDAYKYVIILQLYIVYYWTVTCCTKKVYFIR